MSDPIANAQLELACRLGAIDDIIEALEDGADINCNGNAPIFSAVMANDRAVVEVLVKQGADFSAFQLSSDLTEATDIVDALLGLAPPTEDEPDMDTVDAKQVRAFDRMIRKNGLGEPILKKRGEEYPAVCDALRCIAAEECHACVEEFLAMVEEARKGMAKNGADVGVSKDPDEGASTETQGAESGEALAKSAQAEVESESLELVEPACDADFDFKKFLEANAERIAELSARYVAAEELPGELLKEYAKEMKKLSA